MVHVFANFDGLAKKLTQIGFLKAPNQFSAFATAFSLHQPLFNIVDVGSGKERADHKIKGKQWSLNASILAKWLQRPCGYSPLATSVGTLYLVAVMITVGCILLLSLSRQLHLAPKQFLYDTRRCPIIPGWYLSSRCSHSPQPAYMLRWRYCSKTGFITDIMSGYVPNLDPFKREPARSRISLLETTPLAAGFPSLGFETVKFSRVFRSQELPDRPAIQPQVGVNWKDQDMAPAASMPTSVPPASAQLRVPSPVKGMSKLSVRSSSPPTFISAATKIENRNSKPSSDSMSWATAGGPTKEKIFNVASSPAIERKYVLLNGDEGKRKASEHINLV